MQLSVLYSTVYLLSARQYSAVHCKKGRNLIRSHGRLINCHDNLVMDNLGRVNELGGIVGLWDLSTVVDGSR